MKDSDNPCSLNYWTFNKDYPLHSNAEILITGSAGSGKSYFVYNYLLPIYIKEMNIKTVFICSKTGKLDMTTSNALKSDIYKDVGIDFVKMNEIYERVQLTRAESLINEYNLKMLKIKDFNDYKKIVKDLDKLIKSLYEYEILRNELEELLITYRKFVNIEIEEMKAISEYLYKTSTTKLIYNPIIVIFDDCSGTKEFLKPDSDIHSLTYCRRHMLLNMFLCVQSLTTVSTNIRRNCTIFINFSTLSPKDVESLSDRIPIKWSKKQLIEAFVKISEAENRDDKVITLFTVYPNHKIIIGTPECLKKYLRQ